MSFETIPLNSWDEIQKNAQRGWMYRGQRSAGEHLKTSLERCCDREEIGGADRRLIEREMLRQFRRAYHHYSAHIPNPADALEWLSLMQHHGAPTRLLDFTYSVYVATYFAIERAAKEDCVVWAINGRWALNESITLMKNAGKEKPELLNRLYEESDMLLVPDFFLGDPTVPSVCPQNPFRLNERLRIQKGVFLIPGSIEVSFEENLSAMPGHDKRENLRKLIIPHTDRRKALQQLFEMNISRASLFPGLDGYAESLGVYDPVYEPPWSEEST